MYTFENYAVNIYQGVFASKPLGGKNSATEKCSKFEISKYPYVYLFKYGNRSSFFLNCFEEADSTH
jgi:hypothetical protein